VRILFIQTILYLNLPDRAILSEKWHFSLVVQQQVYRSVAPISDAYLTDTQRFHTLLMNYHLVDETEQSTRRPTWLYVVLLLGFAMSLLIGLAALAGIYLLEGSPPPGAPDEPAGLIMPFQIPPQLALLQLADADADALGRQAVNARERALGYAVIGFDAELSGPRRATEMLRLGQQFLEAGETPQAIDAHRKARTVAILWPDLPALERGQILARSAAGLLEVGATREAVETAQQAQHVAIQAPGLLPAQRAQILESVAAILRTHGTPEEARQVNELLRGPSLGLNRVTLPIRWAELQAEVAEDTLLQEAIDYRRSAVQALIDRILVSGGQDIEGERERVRQALLEEDRLHSVRYARLNEAGFTLAQQHTLIQEQRTWLLLKLRIALGGFGIELAPEWAQQPDSIRLSLRQVTSNLIPVLEAQSASVADPVASAAMRVEVLRWLAYQSELGFFPDAPLGELASRLENAEAELERLSRPPAFPIYFDSGATPPGFRIARRY
jgi:hypothetical protein